MYNTFRSTINMAHGEEQWYTTNVWGTYYGEECTYGTPIIDACHLHTFGGTCSTMPCTSRKVPQHHAVVITTNVGS